MRFFGRFRCRGGSRLSRSVFGTEITCRTKFSNCSRGVLPGTVGNFIPLFLSVCGGWTMPDPARVLSAKHARRILDSYDEQTVDRAYELISHVLDSEDRWGDTIDSKSHLMLAFSVTVLTVIIPEVTTFFTHPSVLRAFGTVVAGAAALGAIVLSFLALHPQAWPGYEDQALLPKLSGSENDQVKAKRFWTYAKLKMHRSIRARLRRKGLCLQWAQRAFVTSVGFLAAVIAYALMCS